MSPFEIAIQSLHPDREEFFVILEAHLRVGVVINTPELFLMAIRHGDRWHVWDAVGDYRQAIRLIGDAKTISLHHRNRYVEIPVHKLLNRHGIKL